MSAPVPPELPSDPRFEQARQQEQGLARQLACFNGLIREELPALWQIYEDFTAKLAGLEIGAGAPRPGEVLPPFLLPGEDGGLISSEELLAEGPLIVSFNRGNWCPYCWLELTALQELLPEIAGTGAGLVSITPEIATFNKRLKRRLGLDFPVLTDLDNGYALQLGLAFAISKEIRKIFEGAKIDLGVFQRNQSWFLPVPALIVADRGGIVRHAYVNADFRQRFDPKDLRKILAEL